MNSNKITNYFKQKIPADLHLRPRHEQLPYIRNRLNEKVTTGTTIKILTFNIQTLDNDHRLHEIVRELKHKKVHIAAIQGTCWGITSKWEIDEYTIHQSGKEKGIKQKHAGVMLIIHKSISQGRTEQIYNIQQGRAIAVRISDRHVDITAISLYVPTEESNESDNTWKQMNDFLRQLPQRTIPLIGTDSNSHIDLTETSKHWCNPHKNNKETPRHKTNNNGNKLIHMLEDNELMLANTNYNGGGWTKQSPDGKSKSLIDYIITPLKLHNKLKNEGGNDYINEYRIRREGTAIDHIPVIITIEVPHQWKKTQKPQLPLWDAKELLQAADNWEQHRKNQLMKQPIPINMDLYDKCEQLRSKIQINMKRHEHMFNDTEQRDEKNLDEMAEALQNSTIEALTETFPYTKTVTIKQEYITNAIWEKINSRQQRWKDILDHAIRPKITNLTNYMRRTFYALKLFTKWHKEKRETQKQLNEAKRKHLDDALKKVSEGNSLQTIRDRHKLLRQFAPKPKGHIQQIRTTNGKYTHTGTGKTSI